MCLKRHGIEPTVLEAGPSVGTSWRRHYRRLHLHTVKEHSSLPGLAFPESAPRYPSRADVVSYLDAYAARFGIVPRTAEPVRRISLVDGVLTVESDRGAQTFQATFTNPTATTAEFVIEPPPGKSNAFGWTYWRALTFEMPKKNGR